MTTERFMEIFNDIGLRTQLRMRIGDKIIDFPNSCYWFGDSLLFDIEANPFYIKDLIELGNFESELHKLLKKYAVKYEVSDMGKIYFHISGVRLFPLEKS